MACEGVRRLRVGWLAGWLAEATLMLARVAALVNALDKASKDEEALDEAGVAFNGLLERVRGAPLPPRSHCALPRRSWGPAVTTRKDIPHLSRPGNSHGWWPVKHGIPRTITRTLRPISKVSSGVSKAY